MVVVGIFNSSRTYSSGNGGRKSCCFCCLGNRKHHPPTKNLPSSLAFFGIGEKRAGESRLIRSIAAIEEGEEEDEVGLLVS